MHFLIDHLWILKYIKMRIIEIIKQITHIRKKLIKKWLVLLMNLIIHQIHLKIFHKLHFADVFIWIDVESISEIQ